GLPWPVVPDDGVENDQQLSSDGDQGDHLRLAGGHQSLEERPQDGVVTPSDHGAHEQRGAYGRASTADEALAAPLAGLASKGSQSGQRCDLLAVEGSQFGQFGDHGACNDRSDAWYGSEQILLLAPGRRTTHRLIDLVIELSQLFLQRLAQPGDALLQPHVVQPPLALAFGGHHLDDLPPAGHQVGQQAGGFVRQRPYLRVSGSGKPRNHRRVDRVGLGALAKRPGKGPDLGRVDDHHRQPRSSQSCRRYRLEATGGFEGHDPWTQLAQPDNQLVQAGGVALYGEGLAARMHGYIEMIL